MSLKILDISKYQPNVDYEKVAKQIDGVILRIGITYWGKQEMGIDPAFEKHYAGFKAVGCPIGVYYYSAADSVEVAKREAEFCLSLMKGKQFELPVFYDVENNERQGNLSKQLLTQIVDAFCSTIQAAGYYVGYYSYTAWLRSKFNVNFLSKKYTLWKADYRLLYDISIPCDMHQYTSKGSIAGINGDVDLNNCFVDFKKIIKEKGLNGFNSTPPTSNLSKESARLQIGQASNGDIKTIVAELESLGIKDNAIENGYIITSAWVSYGDKLTIESKCKSLGIGIKDYVEPPKPQPPVQECEDCKKLKAENQELKENISILENDKAELINKLEIAEKEKQQLKIDKDKLSEKIKQIKNIVEE